MYGLGWLGACLLGATLAAAFGKSWLRVTGLWGLGLLLGFFFVLAVYLNQPPDFAHSGGTDGQEYLGRWWDPSYVLTITGIGYAAWFVGVGVGPLCGFWSTQHGRRIRSRPGGEPNARAN